MRHMTTLLRNEWIHIPLVSTPGVPHYEDCTRCYYYEVVWTLFGSHAIQHETLWRVHA
jgi:hypothetical protein